MRNVWIRLYIKMWKDDILMYWEDSMDWMQQYWWVWPIAGFVMGLAVGLAVPLVR